VKVKMLKPYQRLAAGDTCEMSTPVAQILIGRKVAEEVKESPSVVAKVAETVKKKR